MNNAIRNKLFLVMVGLVAALLLGQLASAQDTQFCPAGIPQWARDRQQYETTYVYAPMAINVAAADTARAVPQWCMSASSTEITYVYVPVAAAVQPSTIPQWVRDRHQYETTYV